MQRSPGLITVNLNELVFPIDQEIKTSFIDDADNEECTEKPLRASETEVAFSVIPPHKSG